MTILPAIAHGKLLIINDLRAGNRGGVPLWKGVTAERKGNGEDAKKALFEERALRAT
jgi:hypothetical protein